MLMPGREQSSTHLGPESLTVLAVIALMATPALGLKPLMWDSRYGVAGDTLNRSPMLAIRDGDWNLLISPDRRNAAGQWEQFSEFERGSCNHLQRVRRLTSCASLYALCDGR